MNRDYLNAKLASLPLEPGCYLMKDAGGKIIYVGKAKKLKSRVNQYFVGAHDYKTQKLVTLITDFDFIVTHTEKEALVLEINLIKKHRPRFNIMFMDDKSYPFLKLTNEDYPRLTLVREKKKDKQANYFGPYPDAFAARKTMNLLNKVFPLRKCVKLPKKVCLYYHLGQCLGPCEFEVNPDVYQQMREDAIKVLRGDTREIIQTQKNLMEVASEKMEFEKAQAYLEIIEALEHISSNQQVEFGNKVEQDVFAYYEEKGYLSIQVLLVRNGKLLERHASLNPLYGEALEVFESYIMQYYESHDYPKEILLPKEVELDALADEIVNRTTQPIKGKKKELLEIAFTNAQKHLEEKFLIHEKIEIEQENASEALNEIVGCSVQTIEVFDNSHTSGSFTVSGMVVFRNGKPSKSDYRMFRLHQENNDYEAMKEVIYRRYFRLVKEQLELPDLILVDGGLIQVNAAKEVLSGFKLTIPIYGLVKDLKHNTAGLMNEEGEVIDIDRNSALFFFLTRVQDEVHRFALSYHQKLRGKAQTKSILDEVPGVGPKRKKLLMNKFGSFKKLKEASIEEIAQYVPLETAENIYQSIHAFAENNDIMSKGDKDESEKNII